MKPPCTLTHAQNLFIISLRELKQKHVRLVREKKELQHKVHTCRVHFALCSPQVSSNSCAHIRLLNWKAK